jgi:hypothetical protein
VSATASRILLLVSLAVMFAACHLFQEYVLAPERQILMSLGRLSDDAGASPGAQSRRDRVLTLRLAHELSNVADYNSVLASGQRPLFDLGADRTRLADLPSRAAALSLGGLRGFLAIYLWMDAESGKNTGDHQDLLDKYHRIADLQPDYTSVWDYHAWNQAWNLSVQWSSTERRWEWVRYGIEFLREGIRRNPKSVDLLETMGRIYEQRIAENLRPDDRAYFTAQVVKEEGMHPLYRAYEWYRKAREAQDETGQNHSLFSKKMLHQKSCFTAHEYAKNLTAEAINRLTETVELQKSGDARAAAAKLKQSQQALAEALAWWDRAIGDWGRQLAQYPDDFNATTFREGAKLAREEVQTLARTLTAEYLAQSTHDFEVRVNSAAEHRLLTARHIYQDTPPEKFQGPGFMLQMKPLQP